MKSISVTFSLIFILLVGCSNGNNNPPPEVQNVAPTVSVSNVSAVEAEEISITAIASDTDGSIAQYAWAYQSGEQVELSGTNTDTVSFTTPQLDQDSEIVLTITVTDNEGSISSADVTVTINNFVDVTISGLVKGQFNSAPNLTLNIADEEFIATADEAGLYSIDISIDDIFADQIVKLTATESSGTSAIQLVSLLGSLNDVVNAANDNNLVTKNEVAAVNISSVTAAIAALLEYENDGDVITESNIFLEATKNIRADLVIPFAIAIKLVTEHSNENSDLALPEDMTNTFELVKNLKEVEEYLRSAITNYEELYNQINSEILADTDIAFSGVDQTVISVADTYYFVSPENFDGDGRLILMPDGSGELIELENHGFFDWTKTDTGVSISYGAEGFVESTLTYFNSDISQLVEVQIISTGKEITWLSQSNNVDLFTLKNTVYRHYPNGEFPDEEPTSSVSVKHAIKTAGVISAAQLLQMDVSYALPIPQTITDISDRKDDGILYEEAELFNSNLEMVFSGDVSQGGNVVISQIEAFGDGTTTINDTTTTWLINDDGHLVIHQGEGFEYVFLIANNRETHHVSVIEKNETLSRASSNSVLLKNAPVWTAESAVGIYDFPYETLKPHERLWIEFNADGTALTVSTNDFNNDNNISENEISRMPGMWRINDMGNLAIRRYMYNYFVEDISSLYCTPLEYDPADDAECIVFLEREWDLYQITQNDEYHVQQTRRLFIDVYKGQLQDPNISGHIMAQALFQNRFWTKVDEAPLEIPPAPATANQVNLKNQFPHLIVNKGLSQNALKNIFME